MPSNGNSFFETASSNLIRLRQSGTTVGWGWIDGKLETWLFKSNFKHLDDANDRYEIVSTGGGGDFPGGMPSSKNDFMQAQSSGFPMLRHCSVTVYGAVPDDPGLPLHPGTVELNGDSGYGWMHKGKHLWAFDGAGSVNVLQLSKDGTQHSTYGEFKTWFEGLSMASSANLHVEFRSYA